MNEFDKIIENDREILIYGKGKIGKQLFHWLNQQNINTKGFIVTVLDNEHTCMGKPVIEVGQVKNIYPEAKILVGVSMLYRDEIVEILNKNDLKDYILFSDKMLHAMSELIYAKQNDVKLIDKKIEQLSKELISYKANQIRLQPKRLIKYEVHITEHCNLNCRGCFHCSPLAKEEFLSVEEYERDCTRLSELYQGDMERIELLGGEPLLHPQIVDFFRITRKCFPVGKIMLVTNGLLLPNMKEDFWLAAKQYKIDITPTRYPINLDYDAIKKKAERYGINYNDFYMITNEKGEKILENYQFDLEGRQSVEENFNNCYRGNYCITLSHGRLYTCAIGAHMHHFKEYFDVKSMNISDRNSIDIYKANSAEEISEFLTRPMPVCRYCKISSKKKYVEFQKSNKKMEEWL